MDRRTLLLFGGLVLLLLTIDTLLLVVRLFLT